jgi:hypothetical protein
VFIDAYKNDRSAAVETMLEADTVASAVCAYMATLTDDSVTGVPTVTATSGEILEAVNKVVDEKVSGAKTWPTTARGFRGMLARAASTLREVGITVTFGGEGRSRRNVTITGKYTPPEQDPARPSQASRSSQPLQPKGFRVTEPGDGCAGSTVTGTGTDKPLKDNGSVDGDGRDGAAGSLSGGGESAPPAQVLTLRIIGQGGSCDFCGKKGGDVYVYAPGNGVKSEARCPSTRGPGASNWVSRSTQSQCAAPTV